jgi:hypothetical protein
MKKKMFYHACINHFLWVVMVCYGSAAASLSTTLLAAAGT